MIGKEVIECQQCGDVLKRLNAAEAQKVALNPYGFIAFCRACASDTPCLVCDGRGWRFTGASPRYRVAAEIVRCPECTPSSKHSWRSSVRRND